jgi:hypothetical protein
MSSANRLRFMILTMIGFLGVLGHQTPVYAAPKMALPEQSFNFREVIEGRTLVHEFVIQNKGDQPLEIQQVKTG